MPDLVIDPTGAYLFLERTIGSAVDMLARDASSGGVSVLDSSRLSHPRIPSASLCTPRHSCST